MPDVTEDPELALVRKYVERKVKEWDEEFVPGKTRIPLSSPTFGAEEILECLDSLVRARVTIGEKVRRFEREFAQYCGVKGGVALNSGSSANLIALAVLTNPDTTGSLRRDDEVIVPAVSWSTTVFPVADVDLMPVLVDVDLETLNMDPAAAEEAMSDRTRAIIPVHLLGNPADMGALQKVAARNDCFVVEDACEAHGARIGDAKVGSFGDLASFSFYFSHHITTIEGGMVVSDNDEFVELGKVLRAHGYSRDLRNAAEVARRYPGIDSRFLFVNRGYNLRPTEIQGAFGIEQLKKLEWFIRRRIENADFLRRNLRAYESVLRLQKAKPGNRHVYLGFPMIVDPKASFSRQEFVDFLESRGVETRPIVAGNLAEHPAMKKIAHKVHGSLPNARLIMRNGLYIGIHAGIGPRHREYIVREIESFLEKRR